jgi:hypothetical protein
MKGKVFKNFDVKDPFKLPKQNRPESLYPPDVVAFKKGTGEIKLIIELESSNVREPPKLYISLKRS